MCNSPVQWDIAGAQVEFDDLMLYSLPGGGVIELAIKAL